MINTKHFKEMLKERDISMEMVNKATTILDKTEEREDGTKHYLKLFNINGGRWLRVIVNVNSDPPRRITAFFDRRLRRIRQ
ncbi:MAG: DUF4258 domain-containing protein [Desulfonatronovibrio sp.]